MASIFGIGIASAAGSVPVCRNQPLQEIKMANLNEVVVHIHEALDEDTLHSIEDGIRQDDGVISVGHNPGKNHMIMVVYDSESTRASTLLHRFQERGLHAQVVGM